ncbi:MAG TPA: recombinase family protein [Vicinamibacterales bacterium]|nr:recombinase family protein [Vicinamibacterales bacterium]
MKAIARAGVEVWFYQDGQRFTYGTLADNVVGFVRAEMNAEFRRQIAKWTREAMERKARAGYVTGGRVFGYDNVRVDGHVERRVNQAEAVVVLRIYEQYAAGRGLPTIAHALNAEAAPSPRAQQGRRHGWCASSVREVLRRPLYRGEIVWGRARKRDTVGQVAPALQPSGVWLRRAAPELRVVSAELAALVDARFDGQRARTLRMHNGQLRGRPPGEGSPYLLTGLLTCGVCGGGMEVLSSASGGRRRFHYRCYVARRKGPACCTNTLPAPMADADAAVLRAVEDTLLHPAVVERAIQYAETEVARQRSAGREDALAAERDTVQAAIRRLTAAIATGGELAPLVEALQLHERQRVELEAQLTSLRTPCTTFDPAGVRQQLKKYVVDWKKLLRAQVGQAQQALRRLVVGRLTFTPHPAGHYTFNGTGTVRPLLSGVVRNLASPTGTDHILRPDYRLIVPAA